MKSFQNKRQIHSKTPPKPFSKPLQTCCVQPCFYFSFTGIYDYYTMNTSEAGLNK